ncbi:MAG: terminase, partial [Clostridia bacterium]
MAKPNILEQALPAGILDPVVMAARDSFWEYAKLKNPSFFKDSRPHLRELCDTLQTLYEGRLIAPNGKVCKRLAISEPPRHGKSYTMSLFNEWILGRDKSNKIINVSYNRQLSIRFGKTVRDGISATKIDPKWRVFSDVFPGVKIKYGDASVEMWSLEGSYFTFLATSFGSTVTGVGCNLMVIDDPIKDPGEAFNERILTEKWDYYRDTLDSRIERGGILIVVMTRWAVRDLVGM